MTTNTPGSGKAAQTQVFKISRHEAFRGIDSYWYKFGTNRPLSDAELFRSETAIRSCLQPRQEFEQQDYELITPINLFGVFLPAGTKFIRVSPDNWVPIVNGARCPSYAQDFTIVTNNPTYFKRIHP